MAAGTGRGDVSLHVGCEQDDTWLEADIALPAVLSTAERLIDPCKVKDPELLAAVDDARITWLSAGELGPGPWGQAGSPTTVGEVRVEALTRCRERLTGPPDAQVEAVVAALAERGLLDPPPARVGPGVGPGADGHDQPSRAAVPSRSSATELPGRPSPGKSAPLVAVLVEPGRQRVLRELLGAAAGLAAALGGSVVAIGESLVAPEPMDDTVAGVLGSWGADSLVVLDAAPVGGAPRAVGGARGRRGGIVEEDVARAVTTWAGRARPDIVLAPSTAWGREVSSRVAAALGAGLTGDAIGLELSESGRLVSWKPAFGGAMVAAIEASSPTQLVTVRPGVLEVLEPRTTHGPVEVTSVDVHPRGRVVVRARRRDDELEVLAGARRVITVGLGVDPADYPAIESLAHALGAEIGATRKVTDAGWLPHDRQVGITGQSLAPDLALVVGASGKFNHMVGLRRAGVVVAVNPDPEAPVFGFADLGLVADWRDVLPQLDRRVREQRSLAARP